MSWIYSKKGIEVIDKEIFDREETNEMQENLEFLTVKSLSSGNWDDYVVQSVIEYVNLHKYSSPVRTLKDMSEEEIQDIEKEYGAKVIRPKVEEG